MFEPLRAGAEFVQLKYLNSQKMITSTKSLMGISKFLLTKVTFISDFGLNFTKSLCLVLLRPAEISLILWLYRNNFVIS